MNQSNLVAQAIRLALAAGMASVVSVSPIYAQDEQADVAVQEKVVVTGSRIKRADYEGPLPVTVITREDIDASGEISVSELLRTQTFNTFGSQKQSPDVPGGNVNTVSMRGLGPWYTLVLVNGRRMASAPTFASSAQNLSMIPLAAVERIEVLRDGASAIYGTDALAGVINIILRKDYNGINLSYMIGRPTQSGGDEDSYSITGGISSDKGNITFGFDAQKQDIVLQRDREFTSEGLSFFGFPGTYFGYLEEDDPRNPTGTFLSVGSYADPRCPSELGSDPDFPWSVETAYPWGGGQCNYAWWGEGAYEAGNDTKSFFLDASYELTDRAEFFARGIFSNNEVTGQWAPSATRLSMPADAPQNPTHPSNPTNYRGDAFEGQSVDVDTDGDDLPDTTVEGPFDLSIGYRNVAGGNRNRNWDDTLLDYVAGLRGDADWLGGSDWELAAQWSEQTSDIRSAGEVLNGVLNRAVENGSFDLFGVFGPYESETLAIASSAAATQSGEAKHRITGGDGQISFDAFQLDHGAVPVVVGFEYRDDDYEIDFDEQTSAAAYGGNTSVVKDVSAARVVKSLFTETSIPLSPKLDLSLAARYDDYNDFGTTINPKASIAFRPLDTVLLRASYGTGSKAPELELLYEPPSSTTAYFIDTWRCAQTDADSDGDGRAELDPDQLPDKHPCKDQEYVDQATFGGNRDLKPEESDNWTAGAVWSPTADLSFIIDYYNIKLHQQIWGEIAQPLLDREFQLRRAGETGARVGDVARERSGLLVNVFMTYQNAEKVETDGFDAEARYAFSAGPLGDYSATLRWTHVLRYEQDIGDGRGTTDWAGEMQYPRDRGQLTIGWALGDYSATAVGNYVSDQNGRFYGWDDSHQASFTTWDMQTSYATPWNGQITVGARNIFDRDPPRKEWGNAAYDRTQHEIYGRVPYLRLEQDF